MAAIVTGAAVGESAASTTLIESNGGPPVPAVAAVDEGQPGRQSLANLLRDGDTVQPLGEGRVKYYKEEKPRRPRRTAAQIIARLSWTTALLALAAVATARPMRAWSPALAAVQNLGAAGLIAVAVLTAAAVLTSTGSAKRGGVLAPAMLGLTLGGTAVGLGIGLRFTESKAAPVAITLSAEGTAAPAPAGVSEPAPPRRPTGVAAPSVTVSLSEAARAGRDAMDRLPGWYGAATSGHAVIRVGEYPASAPLFAELRANFVARPVMVLIAINNGRGTKALTIDPSTLRAEFPDGRRVSALAANDVIAASLADAETEGHVLDKVMRADPGERAALALAFLPEGTDLHDASRLTVVLNGRRVALPGSYLSPQQKADLLHRAAALMN